MTHKPITVPFTTESVAKAKILDYQMIGTLVALCAASKTYFNLTQEEFDSLPDTIQEVVKKLIDN